MRNPNKLSVLENFRLHYKGKPYRIMGRARHSESLETLVVYESLYVNSVCGLWVRPEKMFDEELSTQQPRFRKFESLSEVPLTAIHMIETPNFFDLSYMEAGSEIQREIAQLWKQAAVEEILRGFDPVLAGTTPLGIEIDSSDLDILVTADDPKEVLARIKSNFPEAQLFSARSQSVKSWTIEFRLGRFPVEVFVQNVPTREQRAFLHLRAEARLLRMGGPLAADRVRTLKKQGMKTEPAFAQVFGLVGDPYEELVRYGLCLS